MKRDTIDTPHRLANHSAAFLRLWRACVDEPRGWATRPADAAARAMRYAPVVAAPDERPAAATAAAVVRQAAPDPAIPTTAPQRRRRAKARPTRAPRGTPASRDGATSCVSVEDTGT